MTKPCWKKHSQKRKKVKQFLKKYNILYVGGFPRSTNPRLSTPLHFSAVGECSARRISRGLKREKGVARVVFGSVFVYMWLYLYLHLCLYLYLCYQGPHSTLGKRGGKPCKGWAMFIFLSMQCFPYTSFFSLIFEKVAQHRANDEYKDRPPLVQADGRRAEHGREGKVASN